ncbi:MAG TPA: hypothetical protein VK195_12520 [Burkholderiaceae bacterium]|nr:hypothetical protein [Burkholderiaceae bacterium]
MRIPRIVQLKSGWSHAAAPQLRNSAMFAAMFAATFSGTQRFHPTLCRLQALAPCFVHCDQLAALLAPASLR